MERLQNRACRGGLQPAPTGMHKSLLTHARTLVAHRAHPSAIAASALAAATSSHFAAAAHLVGCLFERHRRDDEHYERDRRLHRAEDPHAAGIMMRSPHTECGRDGREKENQGHEAADDFANDTHGAAATSGRSTHKRRGEERNERNCTRFGCDVPSEKLTEEQLLFSCSTKDFRRQEQIVDGHVCEF